MRPQNPIFAERTSACAAEIFWELFPASRGNKPRAEQSVTIGEMRSDGHHDDLLRQAVRGDEEAFTQLYERHQGELYRFALRMTGDRWAAEEVVQEVFMILLREPGRYDASRGPIGAYLFGIARNRVLKHIERRPNEVSLDARHPDAIGSAAPLLDTFTPAHWAEHHERTELVRQAVLALPPEFREAIVLCELEEMSYEEAAQLIGCPIGTIRSRLSRGRALLLARLELLRDTPRRARVAF